MKTVLTENGDPGLSYSFHASQGCLSCRPLPHTSFWSHTLTASTPSYFDLIISFLLPVLSCRARSGDTVASCPYTASSPATWCINFVSIYATRYPSPLARNPSTPPALRSGPHPAPFRFSFIPWPSFGHRGIKLSSPEDKALSSSSPSGVLHINSPLSHPSTIATCICQGRKQALNPLQLAALEEFGTCLVVSLTSYTVIGCRRCQRRVETIHVLLMGSFQSPRRNEPRATLARGIHPFENSTIKGVKHLHVGHVDKRLPF
ncbi:hypothetical protein LZ30DRAFT_257107 [Colletotrichum cereale]|nr:hypothetical protein LZ30DRAFT_257107 [Colletotrichum cereale]